MARKRKPFAVVNEFGLVVTIGAEIETPLEGEYHSEPPTWIGITFRAGPYRAFNASVTPFEARGLIRALQPFALMETGDAR